MSAPKIRLTAVIMDVLDVLTSSPSDDPAWGLRLCEVTGYGTGTIYPALDRLMKAGWIADPGGCRAMAEEHDLTTPREPAPEAVVRVCEAGQHRDREQAQRRGPGDPFRRR